MGEEASRHALDKDTPRLGADTHGQHGKPTCWARAGSKMNMWPDPGKWDKKQKASGNSFPPDKRKTLCSFSSFLPWICEDAMLHVPAGGWTGKGVKARGEGSGNKRSALLVPPKTQQHQPWNCSPPITGWKQSFLRPYSQGIQFLLRKCCPIGQNFYILLLQKKWTKI